MNSAELKNRTKNLAIDVIRWVKILPSETDILIIQKQLIRCSASVGANYRWACRAKSRADFIHKLKIVEEELDETVYWFEIINALKPELFERTRPLIKEVDELLSIFVKALKTLKSPNNVPKS